MEYRENALFQVKFHVLENREKSPFFYLEKNLENRAYI